MVRDLLVRARGIGKSFGATRALSAVDLDLARGEVHALLGGNGAGKSTLIGILDGVLQPDTGELQVEASGVAVVHQELAVLPDLSVAENIDLGFQRRASYRWGLGTKRAVDALSLLGDSGAAIRPEALVNTLPLHQRQLVEVARALRSGAELILLDEPTASLTAEETDRLFDVIRGLSARGIGIVLVSHRMHEIRAIADVATVLRDGRTVITSAPIDELNDAQIVSAMFGGSAQGPTTRKKSATKRPKSDAVFSLTHEPTGTAVHLAVGEVLGLAGAAQGPSEVMDAIIGAGRSREWRFELDGRLWQPRSPRSAIRRGLGYVSGDRAGKGVFPDLSIEENAILAAQVVNGSWTKSQADMRAAADHADRLGFSHVNLDASPATLSGGTLQKVLIARWLDLPIRVLVLEEPTRGVDVKTKSELYELTSRMKASGVALIWWSTEAAELIAVSDQVLTFRVDGTPAAVRSAASNSEEQLLADTGTAA